MALVSSVQIANMALSKIGARSNIESFTEDSAEAFECDLWYNFSLEQALSVYNWSFARKSLTLAEHADAAPKKRWAFRYMYPSDCVKARYIENPAGVDADPVPFRVELSDDSSQKTIVTDQEDAVLIYTARVQNPALYSPFFIDFLATVLASRIAWTLSGKQFLVDKYSQEAEVMSRVAPAMDAQEQIDRDSRDAEHIRARA